LVLSLMSWTWVPSFSIGASPCYRACHFFYPLHLFLLGSFSVAVFFFSAFDVCSHSVAQSLLSSPPAYSIEPLFVLFLSLFVRYPPCHKRFSPLFHASFCLPSVHDSRPPCPPGYHNPLFCPHCVRQDPNGLRCLTDPSPSVSVFVMCPVEMWRFIVI